VVKQCGENNNAIMKINHMVGQAEQEMLSGSETCQGISATHENSSLDIQASGNQV
jgi:hypothetical protein